MDVRLVLFRENGERRELPLDAGVTSVGRRDDCDIRIPVAEVSRHHCEFRTSAGAVEVKDLESANGTYVNNQRVKRQRLSAGDHVIIGPVVFTVQIDGKPQDIRAVKTRLRTRASVPKSEGDGTGAGGEKADPISALEALASSADQTALDPFDDEEEEP